MNNSIRYERSVVRMIYAVVLMSGMVLSASASEGGTRRGDEERRAEQSSQAGYDNPTRLLPPVLWNIVWQYYCPFVHLAYIELDPRIPQRFGAAITGLQAKVESPGKAYVDLGEFSGVLNCPEFVFGVSDAANKYVQEVEVKNLLKLNCRILEGAECTAHCAVGNKLLVGDSRSCIHVFECIENEHSLAALLGNRVAVGDENKKITVFKAAG